MSSWGRVHSQRPSPSGQHVSHTIVFELPKGMKLRASMFRCAVCRENCWAKERVSSDSTACLIVKWAIQNPLRRFQLRGCESKWRCGHRNPSFMGSYMAVRDWWGAKIRWPRNQRDFARCSAFLEGLRALGPICFKWSTEGQEEKLWLLLRWLRSSRAYPPLWLCQLIQKYCLLRKQLLFAFLISPDNSGRSGLWYLWADAVRSFEESELRHDQSPMARLLAFLERAAEISAWSMDKIS